MPASKPQADSHYLPAVNAYIVKAQPFAQPLLEYIRATFHEAAPTLTEAIKWSMPFFVLDGPNGPIILGNMAAFKKHCSLGFWGSEISAVLRAEGLGDAGGMGTFGKLASLADLPSRTKLVGYIRIAAQSIASGERAVSYTRPKTKAAKPALAVPAELTTALKLNKLAGKNFAAMSPSCQREYSEWIGSAKREETRKKRLATAMEWLAEGKRRNWQYESA